MSDDKIVRLVHKKEPAVEPAEPDVQIVAMLEILLERARTGQIDSLVVAFTDRDNRANSWASDAAVENGVATIGLLELTSRRLQDMILRGAK